jgi:hypothetical protein
MAQRGLGRAQARCCAREAARFGDGHEGVQIDKVFAAHPDLTFQYRSIRFDE